MNKQDLALLKDCLASLGAPADDGKLSLFADFYKLVTEANERFNLTAICDERDFVIKHFIDSVQALPFIKRGARLCDIGAGAGFPSMPLAISREDISVTAIDSTLKKMSFLGDCAKSLGVLNLVARAVRAEEATDLYCSFDVVTARAVAPLSVLLELAAPLLKIGGVFIAYKADDSELAKSKSAQQILNIYNTGIKKFSLPNGDPRALILFEKTSDTPKKYPRRYSAIKKFPL